MGRMHFYALILLFLSLSSTIRTFSQTTPSVNHTAPQQEAGPDPRQPSIETPTSAANVQRSTSHGDCCPVMNVAVEPRPVETSNPFPKPTFSLAFWAWLFGWPGLVFIVLTFFTIWPNRLRRLLSPFDSLNLFGAEFVLSRVGGEEVEERLARLRKIEQEKFDKTVNERQIDRKHHALIDEYMRPVIPGFNSLQIRSTIHVQDLLFEDALYQLLDYYPSQGSGRGRSFSSRRGIIGKAWRLSESQYAEVVPSSERELILEWGMTDSEADTAGHNRHSFGCVILRSGGEKLGLIYFDSPVKRAFGNDHNDPTWKTLEEALTKGVIETGIIADLRSLNRELIRSSAYIAIFEE